MKLSVIGNYGPYGKAGDGCASGYLVENNGDFIVLDMGSGTLSRLCEFIDIKRLKHIFISHLHYDHTGDLLIFRYLLEELSHTVNIYTHREESEWYKILVTHPNFNVIDIDENTKIKADSMELSFVPMKHTVTDYAIIIKGDKTLCYTGDTVFNDNVPKCFEISDCVLADCSKPKGFKGPHMTVEEALSLSKKYPWVKLIATHMSADYDPKEAFLKSSVICAEGKATYNI